MADMKTIGGDGEAEQEATLERLLTRLALTDDSKLESVLAKLLPYAISCLSSPRQSTRQKVLDMLSHINKRVKEQLSIKLPLLDLLQLYQSENTTSMVKNFSLVYMEMALDRHSEDGGDLVPELLKNISKTPIQHQDILLRMAMKEIEKYASRNMDESSAASYTFVMSPADRDLFLEFCLQTMIYQPNTSSSAGVSTAPPGLSQLQATRVAGKSPLKADTLLNRKLGLLNVVAELNLPSEVLYPLLIAACSDSNERVAKRGEELVKKKAAGVNLEDPTLVRKLFSMFQGTLSKEVAADARVSPANRNLKMRLMSIFTRSVTAANSFPATLHCIFDCIYGNESFTRLKQLGLEFTIWTFKHARDEQLKPMAPIILNSVLKLLDGPAPTEAEPFTKQLRTFAYQVIGLLGQRTPYLIRDSTEIAARLFRAFNTESPSMRFTVQEAATTLASAYKGCSKAVAQQVDALLLTNIYAEEGEARFCAVWWAKTVFNFRHCPSRFVCMLGTSDERLDVRDMAMEGLVPTKADDNSKDEYPSLTSMLDFIFEQQPMLSVPGRIGEQDLFFKSKTYISMIDFLLGCYKAESDSSIFEERFAMLLEHAMASNGSAELHARALSGLLALASNSSQRFVELYCTRIEWLLQFIGHVDIATRESVARLLGIVTSGLSRETTVNLLEDLCSKFQSGKKGRYEDMHGAVCTAGFVLAQCMVGVPTIPLQTFHRSLLALVELGRAGTLGLQGAVVEAIGHVGIRGSMPIFQASNQGKTLSQTSTGESVTCLMQAEGEGLNLEDITNLFNDVISSNDTKALQKAVIAYGHLCYGNPKKELLDKALGALFTLTRSKVEEVLFSVGEALCFIWGGLRITADEILKSNFVSLFSASNFLSSHVGRTDGVAESLPLAGEADEERAVAREAIVQKLFDELLFSGRKEDRCAGAVWLVSIITYCGRHPRVQQMLPQIQEALSHLLGEQNELTQEMASRGMSILYDLGDASSKEELVKALVNMLSGTAKRKRAIKLTEDSEVFEEGVLGEKPSGGNITTYKELCNLANEMGQPDLIYKFMDLANHQASMNSKRGAAFGFANIAKQAREALSVYLPSLVPKLIRYQYDPNKQVQDAMGHIWRSIVAEPKKTIDQYFDAIMEDLLLQAGSRLWRSRESSCLALADVLQGRRYQEVENYLEKIWVTTFRAMDDIKETVRTAGNSLSRSVSSLTLRLGDTNLTAEVDAKATVNVVLPVLLSKGVLSNMVEIRQLSITTVMKLAKTAGNAIRPQLPDLIICMLESLSSLEDQRLNYAELHAEKAGISTDKLESLRISVARDSPMWETLDFCLHQVDTPTLAVLIPRLIQLVRSGVGLNTRVGVAKFISLLSQEIGSDMKQYAGSLLKVLKTAVNEERSSSSRRAFAAACAVIAKHAGPSQTQSLFDETIALYQTGTDSAKMTSALLLKELSNQASDVFVNYHSLVLPISFIGRFEEDKTVRSIFEEIWEENTSGQSVSIRLYAADIIPLVSQGLLSTSWKQKLTSAKAIAKLAEGGGDSIVPFVQLLLKGLLDELPSRLWEGKEFLLGAVTAICKYCCNAIPKASDSNTISTQTVVRAVTMACRKKKTNFRNAAFSCLEQILLEFKDKDLFPEVFPFLLQCCNHSPPSKAKAFLTNESNPDENETENTFVASYENVLLCLRSSIATASYSLISAESEAIGTCLVEKLGDFYTWQVKVAAVSAAQAFVEQLKNGKTHEDVEESNVNLKSLEMVFLAMVDCVSNTKIAQMRVASLECLVAMLEMDHFRLHLMSTVGETLNRRLLDLSKLEKNASAKSLIQNILTSLQVGTTDTTSA